LLDFINILTFLWVGFWTVKSLLFIIKGERHAIHFVMIVFFCFFAVHLMLDVILGKPDYATRIGFFVASRDSTTSLIYCFYISIVPVIWWITGKKREFPNNNKNQSHDEKEKNYQILKIMLRIVSISPMLIALFAPNPLIYLQYAATAFGLEGAERDYHSAVETATSLSIFAAAMLLLLQKNKMMACFVSLAPWIFIAIWMNGKRYIVIMTIVLLLLVLWKKKALIGSRFIIASLVVIIGFFVYSNAYQSNVRFDNSDSRQFSEVYENMRIDFGRDHVAKLVIYYELNHLKVLEYRGQSIFFDLLMYVPRSMWEEKPLPYAKYLTSAVYFVEPKLWPYGYTTSILEEAISNFGWFGMLLGPLFISFLCRLGDSCRNNIVSILTIIISILFLAVHLPAFAPIFAIWIVLVAVFRRKMKKKDLPLTEAERRVFIPGNT